MAVSKKTEVAVAKGATAKPAAKKPTAAKAAAKPAAAKAAAKPAAAKAAAKPAAAKVAAKPAAAKVAAKPEAKATAKPAPKKSSVAKASSSKQPADVFHAIGRRKLAVARVFLKKGTGKVTINGKPIEALYPQRTRWYMWIYQPLTLLQVEKEFDVMATVSGGGKTGWAGAIRLGVSRALVLWEKANPGQAKAPELAVKIELADESDETEAPSASLSEEALPANVWYRNLRREGLMTRDPRSVYSKLAGLVKSRKRKQFSKR